MGRKCIIGDCKICGKTKKLTFEHVPPKSTFNNQAVKIVTGNTLLNTNGENERLPWEIQNKRHYLHRYSDIAQQVIETLLDK